MIDESINDSEINVLHICSYFAGNMYHLLIEELRDFSINSRVYYFGRYGYSFKNGEKEYVDCVECHSQIDRLFFFKKSHQALKGMDIYDFSDFDIVHAHSLFANGYLAYLLKKRFGIPYVVAVRNTDVNTFFRKQPHLRQLGLRILENSSKVVFISPSYKDMVLKAYIPKRLFETIEEKSLIIPNGINEMFLNSNPEPHQLRNKLNVKLLQTGDISNNKNQAAVLKACKLLENAGVTPSYRVIGKVCSKRVEELLASSPFVSLSEFIPQEELIKEYRLADVFVMPSHYETFGLAYIEAMSQGAPVIYSKGQGIDGYFEEGLIGYSVDPNSPDDICNKVLQIMKNETSISENCITQSRRFNWKQIAEDYSLIYKNMMQFPDCQ